VLHENVRFLGNSLTEANFHVVITDSRLDEDFDTRMAVLSHRLLITKNTAAYIDDAPVLDYGIIELDALPFINPAVEYKTNRTAQLISHAILDFDLVLERCGLLLMLKQDGNHVFKRLG
jgi:hypothetical protein